MKKKKVSVFKKVLDAISSPFIAVACFIDECKLANEDGSWDTYWAKENKKEEKKKNV